MRDSWGKKIASIGIRFLQDLNLMPAHRFLTLLLRPSAMGGGARRVSRSILVGLVTTALTGCALRPTLEAWGLLDAPKPEPTAAPRVSLRQVQPPEAHRFAIGSDQDLFGSLMALTLRDADTLPDVARHYGLGFEELAAANPGVDPWVPDAKSKVLIPLQFLLPNAPRKGIVINLAAMRLFHFARLGADREVVTYPVGIGREGRATPTGTLWIQRKKEHPTWYPTAQIRTDHSRKGDPLPASVSPGPDNPLGDYAMYLSRQPYLIHGTNKPYSIGWRASNGCIRLYPENIAQLFPAVPVKEAVTIVNQPYLTGWRDGTLYLQAYRPQEELSAKALQKRLRAELRKIESTRQHPLAWDRVDRIISEARGIPLPVSAQSATIEQALAQASPLDHPWRFRDQPELPPDRPGAWNVLVDESVSESTAKRLAAFLNHQGPVIPARVQRNGERYQVLAGPYPTAGEAKTAVRRLKIELELAGQVIEPTADLAAGRASSRTKHGGTGPARSVGTNKTAPARREQTPANAAACELARAAERRC